MALVITTNPMAFGPVVVTTAGTPVLLNSALIAQALALVGDPVPANKIALLGLPTNTGSVYIGAKNMNKTTLAGVIIKLGPLGGNQPISYTITDNVHLNQYRLDLLYADADNNGEGLYGHFDPA